MNPILVPLCIVLLAGCASPQEQLAQQESQREALTAALIARCTNFGFRPGTDAFAGCIERVVTNAERCAKERSAAQAMYYQELSRRSAQSGSTFIAASSDASTIALRGLSPECQN